MNDSQLCHKMFAGKSLELIKYPVSHNWNPLPAIREIRFIIVAREAQQGKIKGKSLLQEASDVKAWENGQ